MLTKREMFSFHFIFNKRQSTVRQKSFEMFSAGLCFVIKIILTFGTSQNGTIQKLNPLNHYDVTQNSNKSIYISGKQDKNNILFCSIIWKTNQKKRRVQKNMILKVKRCVTIGVIKAHMRLLKAKNERKKKSKNFPRVGGNQLRRMYM